MTRKPYKETEELSTGQLTGITSHASISFSTHALKSDSSCYILTHGSVLTWLIRAFLDF